MSFEKLPLTIWINCYRVISFGFLTKINNQRSNAAHMSISWDCWRVQPSGLCPDGMNQSASEHAHVQHHTWTTPPTPLTPIDLPTYASQHLQHKYTPNENMSKPLVNHKYNWTYGWLWHIAKKRSMIIALINYLKTVILTFHENLLWISGEWGNT
jgi:hypothetical protein